MTIVTSIPNSFKVEILRAIHDLSGGADVCKAALYTSAASLSAATAAYTASNEVVGTGYTAGGANLTNITPALDVSTAICDFNDLTFSTVSLTARGCMLYNSSKANRAIYVGDFGADKTASAGDFTLVFPAAAAGTAIIRIA